MLKHDYRNPVWAVNAFGQDMPSALGTVVELEYRERYRVKLLALTNVCVLVERMSWTCVIFAVLAHISAH